MFVKFVKHFYILNFQQTAHRNYYDRNSPLSNMEIHINWKAIENAGQDK